MWMQENERLQLSQKRSWQSAVISLQLKTNKLKGHGLCSTSYGFAFYCKLITANFC